MNRNVCLLLAGLAGCSLGGDRDPSKGEPLARVYDKYLYHADVQDLGLTGLAAADSIALVTEYVNNWVMRNLMVAYAERNLPKEKLELEEQIQNYRESLLMYSYETEYLAQKLDTLVSEQQIAAHYRDHEADFVLDEDIYRIYFIVISKDDPKVDSVKTWMRADKPGYRPALESYASRYAIRANLSDSAWFSHTELASLFPSPFMNLINPGNHWPHNWSDSTRTYVSMITQSEIKGQVAPLSFVRDRIRKIILLQKKTQILDALRQGIQADALKNEHYEIF